MRIEEIGPADTDRLTDYWKVTVASEALRPRPMPWHYDELLADLKAPTRRRVMRLFVGYDGDRAVATGAIGMPQLDNLESAHVFVYVHPDALRRGHGSEMLTHLEAVGAAAGRTKFGTEAPAPIDAPADGSGTPAGEFGARHGYRVGNCGIHSVADVSGIDFDALIAEAAPHHTDYRIVSFTNPVPDEWLDGYVALDAALSTEAPLGELEVEQTAADVAAYRELEELIAAQGRVRYTTIAVDPSGVVVAYTDLAAPRHDPETLFQWGTLVARDHRGHRLGMAVKAANLAQIRAVDPARHFVETFNAEQNDSMRAINSVFGFVPIERDLEMQKVVAT